MSATKRIIGWFMLVLFTSGCSTYRPASIPTMETDPGAAPAGGRVVEVGDWVQIELVDGTEVEGSVRAVSAVDLSLGAWAPRIDHHEDENVDSAAGWSASSGDEPTNEPTADEELTAVPYAQIRSIEKRVGNHGATVALGMVAVGVVVGAVSFQNSMDSFME